MQRSLTALAACLLFSAAAIAPASANEWNTRHVSYADLNLGTPSGARAMLHRIDMTARNMCGDRDGPRPLAESIHVRNCVAAKTEAAVTDLSSPMVMRLYYGREPSVIVASR